MLIWYHLSLSRDNLQCKMTNVTVDIILFNYMVPLCNIVESSVIGLIRTQVAVLSAAVIVLTESTSATSEYSFIYLGL